METHPYSSGGGFATIRVATLVSAPHELDNVGLEGQPAGALAVPPHLAVLQDSHLDDLQNLAFRFCGHLF